MSRFVAGVLALMVLLGGCGSSGSSDSADEKYTQTWGKQYSATSCDEWLNQMSPGQRFAASADMLTGARNKGDGGTGVPEDDLIDEFAAGVDSTCDAGASSLAEAGALTYLADRSHYRP